MAGNITDRSAFALNRPGALIAALPAVLGFTPESSLVVVTVRDGCMGAVLRVDLDAMRVDLDANATVAPNFSRLAAATAGTHPDSAIAVIVDAEGAGCEGCEREHVELAEKLGTALGAYGVELLATHVVDRVAAGATWRRVDGCGAGGVIDDPRPGHRTGYHLISKLDKRII